MSILDSGIRILNMQLSNRLVMPPMASGRPAEDGTVSQALCEYYGEKSHGGYLGLVITEHAYVSVEGKAHKGQLSIAEDGAIPGLKQLVDTIHANGSKVIAQISHAGGAAERKVTGCNVLSVSAVKSPRAAESAECPLEMTTADIQKVILDFKAAAIRAKQAGFDGVEIHSAHGYLLNQFYSPLLNHRTDAYCGTSLDGRLRLHLEIIQAIRRAVGGAYPIAVRLGACDYMDGGTTVEDSVQAAQIFQKAGVDLLDISGGLCGPYRPQATEEGYFRALSAAIKGNVSIPVLLTGGIITAQGAESLLGIGATDLIGVGRALKRDSDWAENAIRSLS